MNNTQKKGLADRHYNGASVDLELNEQKMRELLDEISQRVNHRHANFCSQMLDRMGYFFLPGKVSELPGVQIKVKRKTV